MKMDESLFAIAEKVKNTLLLFYFWKNYPKKLTIYTSEWYLFLGTLVPRFFAAIWFRDSRQPIPKFVIADFSAFPCTDT